MTHPDNGIIESHVDSTDDKFNDHDRGGTQAPDVANATTVGRGGTQAPDDAAASS